jgi:hypothetical protein
MLRIRQAKHMKASRFRSSSPSWLLPDRQPCAHQFYQGSGAFQNNAIGERSTLTTCIRVLWVAVQQFLTKVIHSLNQTSNPTSPFVSKPTLQTRHSKWSLSQLSSPPLLRPPVLWPPRLLMPAQRLLLLLVDRWWCSGYLHQRGRRKVQRQLEDRW